MTSYGRRRLYIRFQWATRPVYLSYQSARKPDAYIRFRLDIETSVFLTGSEQEIRRGMDNQAVRRPGCAALRV
ncbi:MAG: hypothetical protein DSY90_09215 [Deltaproteobacteria bacterium]|nr:MAG: hypothetical protein DSY90_09215 [Deltaproteobacteria bacterium]